MKGVDGMAAGLHPNEFHPRNPPEPTLPPMPPTPSPTDERLRMSHS